MMSRAETGRELVAERRAAREAMGELKGPRPYHHRSTSEQTAVRPPQRAGAGARS